MTRVDPHYFPPGVFSPDDADADDFTQQWYGKHLRSMNELRLFDLTEPDRTVFRYLCMPAFHAPYVIRVDISTDGACLTAKKTNGRGGYGPGKVVFDESVGLSSEQCKLLLSSINARNFWSMPTNGLNGGKDGTQCVMEGRNETRYHVVSRWERAEHFLELRECFLDLCPPDTCAAIKKAR